MRITKFHRFNLLISCKFVCLHVKFSYITLTAKSSNQELIRFKLQFFYPYDPSYLTYRNRRSFLFYSFVCTFDYCCQQYFTMTLFIDSKYEIRFIIDTTTGIIYKDLMFEINLESRNLMCF